MKQEVYRAVSSIVLRRLPLKEPKTLSAAAASDVRDTFRKSSEIVYLVVKKPRKHHAYQFPQGGQDSGETASEAALRELREECGTNLKVKLIDDSPIGAYQYKFPPKFNRWDNSVGAKVNTEMECLYYLLTQCILGVILQGRLARGAMSA